MIRLKDVARQAGVSITTVSHVVNDTRRVAPATLERVQRAISQLGYRPDSVARTLKSNRSHTIGMPPFTSPSTNSAPRPSPSSSNAWNTTVLLNPRYPWRRDW